jgi:hypothetical protein
VEISRTTSSMSFGSGAYPRSPLSWAVDTAVIFDLFTSCRRSVDYSGKMKNKRFQNPDSKFPKKLKF